MGQGFTLGWRRALAIAVLLVMSAAGAVAVKADGLPITKRAEAVALVRATLLRLNDANLTADYKLLRATGAPDFQARFSEAELSALFSSMRAKGIDLTRFAALEPAIEAARYHTGQNVLQISGTLNAGSVETRFVFSYQNLDNGWKLYGLNLDFVPAATLAGAQI